MFSTREIDYRSVAIEVTDKLRGSRARALADLVEDLKAQGFDRLILDLTACGSIDSLGAAALDRAIEVGHELYLVVAPGSAIREYYPVVGERVGKVEIFQRVDDAIRSVKALEESGVVA